MGGKYLYVIYKIAVGDFQYSGQNTDNTFVI
jgi:hypothetical protein